MKECDNITHKIHISSNFTLSISLLMLDTLLLRPSLHCNTPLHFTQLHFTTFIDTSLPLIYTSLPFHLALYIYISCRSISPHITKLDTVQSHLQTYFQNNKPLHCPKELLTISLHLAQPIGPIFKKMGPIGCAKTSVRNYHYLLHNNAEKRSSHLLSGRSLESRKIAQILLYPQCPTSIKLI
jgi:hypothetical protein